MLLVLLTISILALAGGLLTRRLVAATETRAVRAMAAATIALGLAVATARLLLVLGWFYLPLVWAVAVVSALGVTVLVTRRTRRTSLPAPTSPPAPTGATATPPMAPTTPPAPPTPSVPPAPLWRRLWARPDAVALLPLAVAAVAVGLALTAAAYLPIWAWDAVGYHLPFVNYVVQARSAGGVPYDMPYVSSYPHNADFLFALVRLGLPDDTWIDGVQIPLGLIGAGAIAALAHRWGARPGPALAAGALWLAIPGVFLQLPSGYVDVCVATFLLLVIYWVLAPPSRATLLLTGVALGLYLGSKPSAPLPALLLLALAVVRAWRGAAGRPGIRTAAMGMAAVTFALGAPEYVVNLGRFGNPVWPIQVDVGPIHLPGRRTLAHLLAAGAHAPRVEGPTWWRIVQSWTSFRAIPAFDMRVGGFGTVAVLFGIPGALFAIRRVPRAAWGALVASLLGPDPAVARFILAFPALCLALAAVTASRLRGPFLVATVAVATVLAALDVRHAAPALAGEGPPLSSYPAMSPEERLRAVGPVGRPDRWIDLRRSLPPGEAFAFDDSFDLSYLLWRRHLENRVVFVSASLSVEQVEALLIRERVRVLIAEPESPAGAAVMHRPSCYRRLFACPAQPCFVYEVQSPECLREGT